MAYLNDLFLRLTRQLHPKGRAFKAPLGGVRERLDKALIRSEVRVYEDMEAIKDSLYPDNDGFTADDCTDWEGRLWIPTVDGLSLEVRKMRIARKMGFPGTVRPRQSRGYMEAQLRAAGFDVYVFENRFDDGAGGWETRTPFEILGVPAGEAVLDGFELGEVELDMSWGDAGITLCVDHILAADDAGFAIGSNYRSTFYVTGVNVDDFASVDARREAEFRQLIMKLKPCQMCGILFVNYV